MNQLRILLLALCYLLVTVPVFAAPLRVYVSDIHVVGASNKDEMKSTLQTLLSSRLNSDRIMAVGNASEADVLVTGTYVAIGKVFSVDALAKTIAGQSLTRAFVQGENQDELIPLIGTLAEKLGKELGTVPPVTVTTVPAPASAPRSADIIAPSSQVQAAPAGEFIKPQEMVPGSPGSWQSKRLDGASNLMAVGRTLANGQRELFLAEDQRLSYYHQGSEMKLITAVELKGSEKIISVDTSVAVDGNLDIYLTIIRSFEPVSQVWHVKDDKFTLVAGNLPYFFRSISLAGAPKKIYAQAMGRDADFYGDIAEVTRTGTTVTLKNPMTLPRQGNLYSVNQFRDRGGKLLTVLLNADSYLVVYDQQNNELWRSNDKFGGSELFFQKDDANPIVSGDKFRSIFMNQRIQVSSRQEVLVGKNDGFWVLGDARSYKKGAVYCMIWNGSSLEEKWRTKDTQNYMSDYYFDEGKNDLLMLQTVQRPSLTKSGASALAIKKVN